MADSKITALTAISTVDPAADPLVIVDVSDTSMAASGTTKKITSNQILGAGGTATLASATITGDLTVRTTGLVVNSTGVGAGVSPGVALDVQQVSPMARITSTSTTGYSSLKLRNTGASGRDYEITVGGSGTGAVSAGNIYIYDNTASAVRLLLDSSGNLGLGVTPSAGGGVLQLKSGITFPATQVASSDANTLDDYEEGTWTPTITSGSGTPTTVTVNSATYTKVGRLCTVSFNVTITDKGTAAGSLRMTLPFAQTVSSSIQNCGSFSEQGTTGKMGQIYYASTTVIDAWFYDYTTVWTNSNRIIGTYSYFV